MREYGSEYSNAWLQNDYFDNLLGTYDYGCYVRTGREALALTAQMIPHNNGDVILLPAYCCRTMEWPFEDYGWSIEFYRLKEDLTIDEQRIEERIKQLKPAAVLVMNYYGFADIKETTIDLIKTINPNIKVIEDFSHTLLSARGKGSSIYKKIDYRIASIRKSIGVPDGGIFLSKVPYNNFFINHNINIFTELRKDAFREKERFFYSYEESLRVNSKEKLRKANESLTRPIEVFAMSQESIDIIKHVDIYTHRYARHVNYNHLYSLLKDNKKIKILYKPSENNISPFSMPILFENRYFIQKAMADNGLFLPVVWTINDRAKLECNNSKQVSENMLSIPIDQRFDWYDIEDIADRINSFTK